MSVSQLAAHIGRALADGLPPQVRVIGEVSGFRERTHWYFDLKDAGAVIGCAMWASTARRGATPPENGREYIVHGSIDFYPKGGKTTLIAQRIEPVGLGALEAAYRALCEELRAVGWFDEARKRPLPTLPRRVAVVTSRTGAALQDVLETARQRCPAVGWLVADARVQGPGAAEDVARRVRTIGAHHERLGVDAILVTRGGGSLEDLWAFNERVVAEAIVASPVPVVAAIGHETDTTIAELVADRRCATPTQAAVALTPDAAELGRQISVLAARLRRDLTRQVELGRGRVLAASRYALFADPEVLLDARRGEAEHASARLHASMRARLREAERRLRRAGEGLEPHRPAAVQSERERRLASARARLAAALRHRVRLARADMDGVSLDGVLERAVLARRRRLDGLARELRAVGPAEVLARGYSVTRRADGSVLRSAEGVAPGTVLTTTLADGDVSSVVGGSSRRHGRPMQGAGQMDLFGAKGYLDGHERRQAQDDQP